MIGHVNSSGSFAKFTLMRRASSLLEPMAAREQLRTRRGRYAYCPLRGREFSNRLHDLGGRNDFEVR